MENGHAVDVPDYDRFVGAVCRGRKPYALRGEPEEGRVWNEGWWGGL